jgi:ELWxxDGT repeat protein
MVSAGRFVVALVVAVASSVAVAQGPAYLVKDINRGADPDASSSPGNFARSGNLTLFTADDGIHGCELWRTNGTASGTELVADLNPGSVGSCSASLAAHFSPLASDGRDVFLRADTGDGDEIWSSDGTAAGTIRVKHFGRNLYLDHLTVIEGEVFFTVLDGIDGGYGIWHSDGTEAGTEQLRHFDLPPGPLVAAAGHLFFLLLSTSTYPYTEELWTSDGTTAGTMRLPGPGAVDVGWLTPLRNELLFAAGDSAQLALWTSNGTIAGTRFVASLPESARPIGAIGGAFFFTTTAQTAGTQLWKSDGTSAGTSSIGLLPGIDQYAMYNVPVEGNSIFVLSGYGNYEVWKTDTAASPPTFLKALPPDLPYAGGPVLLKGIENRLFLVGRSAGFGAELWTSDGTADGTAQVKDVNPGAGSSSIGANGLTDAGVLLFAASDGTHGTELWRSDGTPAGTWLVKDINEGASHSRPDDLTTVGGTLFFTAFDLEHGRELWSSDGSESGTTLVRDLYPAVGGAFDLDATQLGGMSPQLRNAAGRLFFVAEAPGLNAEVWSRDPSSGALVLSGDIAAGPASSDPLDLTVLGNRVLFIASTPVAGGLWSTDGQGYGRVGNLLPFGIGANSGAVFVSGTSLLADGPGATKPRLWKLAEADPAPVLLGEFNDYPMGITGVERGAFFWLREPYCSYPSLCRPLQIWKTDGTAAGTVHVTNVGNTCPSEGYFYSLSSPTSGGSGTFYFTVYDPFYGQELYTSDGTAAGTHMVADIYPGSEPQFECPLTHSSAPHELTPIGNLLYFAAYEPDHGIELWRTDGSAAGTVLVKDINPGTNSSAPTGLTNVTGILLFSADDGVHGAELWVSDGTASGTHPLIDIASGALSSSPAAFAVAGEHVFFAADDGEHGRELWAIPLAALPPTLTPTPVPPTATPTPATSCAADCSGNNAVTVDELIICVNIDLGLATLDTCPACNICGSPDCDLEVTINEILVAVNYALWDCPPPADEY